MLSGWEGGRGFSHSLTTVSHSLTLALCCPSLPPSLHPSHRAPWTTNPKHLEGLADIVAAPLPAPPPKVIKLPEYSGHPSTADFQVPPPSPLLFSFVAFLYHNSLLASLSGLDRGTEGVETPTGMGGKCPSGRLLEPTHAQRGVPPQSPRSSAAGGF